MDTNEISIEIVMRKLPNSIKKHVAKVMSIHSIKEDITKRRNSRISAATLEAADVARRKQLVTQLKVDLHELFPCNVKFISSSNNNKLLPDAISTMTDGLSMTINTKSRLKIVPHAHSNVITVEYAHPASNDICDSRCTSYYAALKFIASHLVEDEVIQVSAEASSK